MSSTTSHALLGDPKNGGALFLLPPEIRETIYRFLVKDRYAVIHSRLHWQLAIRGDPSMVVRPKVLSILRFSKAVCGEATKILYSETVFRFAIANLGLGVRVNAFLDDDNIDRVKKFAPMMKYIILDVNAMSTAWAYYVLEALMRNAVDLFGGIDIRR